MVVHMSVEKTPFTEFAAEFAKNYPETLQTWVEHGDPIRKAAAKIIMEAVA